MIGWTGIRCPKCGAEPGEECFETDRIWGKKPLDGPNSHHEERIRLVLRTNREAKA